MKKYNNPRLGKCYELSYKYVVSNADYILIHGIITDNKFGTGKSLDHAWVEKDDIVYDLVMDVKRPKEIYYNLYSVKVIITYTRKETIDMALEEGTYGPWHPKLKFYKPIGF